MPGDRRSRSSRARPSSATRRARMLSDLRESGADRAGRRRGRLPLPRGRLRAARSRLRAHRACRGDHRQAQKRPGRNQAPRLPRPLPEVRRLQRPGRADRAAGGRVPGPTTNWAARPKGRPSSWLAPLQNRKPGRVCPLGVCDGSGWILGPEDVARPCDCRADRLRRARTRGIASVIPAKYRGVSSTVRRSPRSTDGGASRPLRYTEDLDANLDAGRGLWLMGDTGTGKTTLAMLISKQVLAGGAGRGD